MRVADFNLAIIDVVRVTNAGRILASMQHEWRAPGPGPPQPAAPGTLSTAALALARTNARRAHRQPLVPA